MSSNRHLEYQKQYYRENMERRKAYFRDHWAKNRERLTIKRREQKARRELLAATMGSPKMKVSTNLEAAAISAIQRTAKKLDRANERIKALSTALDAANKELTGYRLANAEKIARGMFES